MCDPKEIIVEAVSDSVAKALESKPVENLLGPVTSELGLALCDVASVFRFYVSENLRRIFTKWAAQRDNKPLRREDIRRVLPLLHNASLESDDELQERWAALLESSTSDLAYVSPSFGTVLAQLTAAEARFLERLWKAASRPRRHWETEGDVEEPFNYKFMVDAYEPGLFDAIPHHYLRQNPQYSLSERQLEAIESETKVEYMIQDLVRVGILATRSELIPGKKETLRYEQYVAEVVVGDAQLGESTFFTPFGRSFARAVMNGH